MSAAAGRGDRLHEVVTPEGVPIRFAVALAGDRAGAFLLDVLLVVAVLLALALPAGWLALRGLLPGDLAVAVLLLATFLVRTFYFSFFELLWQGQTPGKRKLGLRVVDARGGVLTAEAILTRNLTRELEVFLPGIALLAPELLFAGAPVPARLLALAWMLVFGLLPLLNRDRLRVGDLVAGTIVVRTPVAVLLDDLVARPPSDPAAAPGAIGFTPEQLDVYGEYELQVLEGVLRRAGVAGGEEAGMPGSEEAIRTVAERIRRKIGWEGPPGADRAFLEAFYAALRARLERRLLFGKRRAHKHDREGG